MVKKHMASKNDKETKNLLKSFGKLAKKSKTVSKLKAK